MDSCEEWDIHFKMSIVPFYISIVRFAASVQLRIPIVQEFGVFSDQNNLKEHMWSYFDGLMSLFVMD